MIEAPSTLRIPISLILFLITTIATPTRPAMDRKTEMIEPIDPNLVKYNEEDRDRIDWDW